MAASTVLSSRALLLHVAAHPYTLLSSRRPRRPVRCSSSSPAPATHRRSRRTASIALLVLHFVSSRPDLALAGPFDRYVKRKKLDPLEAYVPAVLLTQAQFEDLEKTLDLEQPKYDFGRSLLRSGPAASLRVNIRAVAQYAADDGKGQTASDAVDRCLRALEELDSLLLNASRNDRSASVDFMKSKISIAKSALNSLLQTVPVAVLDKGKAIADSYRMPDNLNGQSKQDDLDPSLKQLESIL